MYKAYCFEIEAFLANSVFFIKIGYYGVLFDNEIRFCIFTA